MVSNCNAIQGEQVEVIKSTGEGEEEEREKKEEEEELSTEALLRS